MLPICITQEVPQCCWHQKKSLMLLLLERRLGSPFGSPSSTLPGDNEVHAHWMIQIAETFAHCTSHLPTQERSHFRKCKALEPREVQDIAISPSLWGGASKHLSLVSPLLLPLSLDISNCSVARKRAAEREARPQCCRVSSCAVYLTSPTFLFRVIFPSVI